MKPVIISIEPLKLKYTKGNGCQTPGNGARLTTLVRKQQKRKLLKQQLAELEE